MKIINLIKQKILNNKILVSNFGYLSVMQIFTMLVPLITYPYLIKTLGVNVWGRVVFASSIVTFFNIFINFGFSTIITKEVSIHRGDKCELSNIVSSVYVLKTILFIMSFLVLVLLVTTVPMFKEERVLFLFSFGLCITEWIFPMWYFQGIEQMKYITTITVFAKLMFVGLIFVFVKSEVDYLNVPILNSIGGLIGGVISLWVVFVKHKIKFVVPKVSVMKEYLREGSYLFTSVGVSAAKDRINIIFINVFLGSKGVAIYDLGIKLVSLFTAFITLVNRTIYPKIAKEKNVVFFKKTLKLLFFSVLIIIIVVQMFLTNILYLVGKEDVLSYIEDIRIILLDPLFYSIGLSLSMTLIPVYKKYKAIMRMLGYAVVSYFTLITIFYMLELVYEIKYFFIISLLVHIIETIYIYTYVVKNKLI